ncbi:MAG: hypothetical protein RLZZ548_372, partial [Bacteroidota bacterium]
LASCLRDSPHPLPRRFGHYRHCVQRQYDQKNGAKRLAYFWPNAPDTPYHFCPFSLLDRHKNLGEDSPLRSASASAWDHQKPKRYLYSPQSTCDWDSADPPQYWAHCPARGHGSHPTTKRCVTLGLGDLHPCNTPKRPSGTNTALQNIKIEPPHALHSTSAQHPKPPYNHCLQR